MFKYITCNNLFMRTLLLIICLLVFYNNSSSQDKSVEFVNNLNSYGLTYIHETNLTSLGGKPEGTLSYDDVIGSAFWDDKWQKAIIVCGQNKIFTVQKVKLNLYSNDVYYIDDKGRQLVVSNVVNKVLFYSDEDSTKPSAVFEKFSSLEGADNTGFYQSLNAGNTKLLKLTTVKIESGLDPLLGKTIHRFSSKYHYSIYFNNTVNTMNKLNKDNILKLINPADEIKSWLKTNNNQLKNEAQVITFFEYYNASIK